MVQVALGPDAGGERVRTFPLEDPWSWSSNKLLNHFLLAWVEQITRMCVALYNLHLFILVAIFLLVFKSYKHQFSTKQ